MSKDDSGTYSCVAENNVGSIKSLGFVYVKGKHLDFCFTLCNGKPTNKSSVTLNSYLRISKCLLHPSPEPPIIDGDIHSNRIEPLGGNAILNCEVRGDPLPTIRWSKKGISVPISNRIRQLDNGSLAIYGTVVHKHNRYSCIFIKIIS